MDLFGMGAQDVHLDFHTAPELWLATYRICFIVSVLGFLFYFLFI